jgi:glycosyltransferase involved in cell wall biosynthesis
LTIAWVSVYDATNPSDYEGRGYYAPLSLRKQSVAVKFVGPLRIPTVAKARMEVRRVAHALSHDNRIIHAGARRWYSSTNAPLLYKEYARQISHRLAELGNVDVVCSGVSPYSQPVSYLECEKPIAIWTDTTYASAIDFYPQYFTNRICRRSIADILANETAALRRCRLAIYASEWGARDAVSRYGLDSSKVKVVPFGANLECTRSVDDIERIVQARSRDKCRLLFVGVEWHRKGGDIAYQVAKALNKAHFPTELTIVGCDPVLDEPLPGYVKVAGHIPNSTAEGSARLRELFSEAHFFVMPSRAESFGHVFCEASSFGVPSIATNVGGIPTAVRNDINGRTFSVSASVDEYCGFICDTFSDWSRYRKLALSSFREYESRLNWAVAGSSVKKLLSSLI